MTRGGLAAWVAVPTHNNAPTVGRVVRELRRLGLPIVVVDDGSTDGSGRGLAGSGVTVLRHERNRGKGAAILTAARHVAEHGGTHLVVFDADGQLSARDVPRMLAAAARNPRAIVCGVRRFAATDVPRSSRFGRRFSNFWVRVIGGKSVSDSQCGFRVYPLCLLRALRPRARRYDFEVEILVRAAWAGVPLVECPVAVTYAPPEGRRSSFRMVWDNARITATNTRLFLRMILPLPPPRIMWEGERCRAVSLEAPRAFLAWALRENGSPGRLGGAVAIGLFLGTLPLVGFHTVAVLAAAALARVNRLSALLASQLCAPPFVPMIALGIGHWLLRGEWLRVSPTHWSWTARFAGEYLLGSIVLAPVLAAVGGGMAWMAASALGRRGGSSGRRPGPGGDAVLTGRFGPPLGILFFRLSLAFLGPRVTRWLTLPVVPFYYARGEVRRLLAPYVARRFAGRGSLGRQVAMLRILLAFAGALVDQAAVEVLGPRRLVFRVEREEELGRLLGDRRGKVLLLSHFGNWKVALPHAAALAGRLHLLMHDDPADPFRGRGLEVGVISPAEGPHGLVRATAALLRGDAVAIMADRPWGGRRVAVPLLGDTAWLPASPYRLALSTGSWLVMLVIVPDGAGRYRLVHRVLQAAGEEGPGDRDGVGRLAAAYARELERWLAAYPYHWFNFVDLWRAPAGARDPVARAVSARRPNEHRARA